MLGWFGHGFAIDPAKRLTQYVRTVYTTEEGLPHWTVLQILQTRDGYLWLGTFDGLARFDGARFTVFERGNTPEIMGSRVTALCEGRDGSLWIGFGAETLTSSGTQRGGGLVRYKDGTFSVAATRESLPDDLIRCIFEDGRGRLWIGTSDGLVCRDETGFTVFTTKQGLPANNVRTIAEARDGGLWIGTVNGMCAFRDGVATVPSCNRDLPNPYVTKIYEDRTGLVWVGTLGGVACFRDGRMGATFTPASGLADGRISSILEDKDGNVWVSSYGGLNRFRAGRLTDTVGKDALLTEIQSLFEDREGGLWIGTGQGLVRLRDGKFTVFGPEEGLLARHTAPILEDRAGNIWIGNGSGGGLNRVTDGVVTTYTERDGFRGIEAVALYEDEDGGLWIGSRGSISRLRDGRFTTFTDRDGVPPGPVRVILRDRRRVMWIGADRGVYRFDGSRVVQFTDFPKLMETTVRHIREDRQGTLWFSTTNGLCWLAADGRFGQYTTADGLPDMNVGYVHEDGAGVLWVGSPGGLSRVKDGKIASITARQGLFSGVHALFEDDFGRMWMTSNKGIYWVARADIEAVADGRRPMVTCTVYDNLDGLRNRECNGGRQPAGYRTRSGKLWFPTVNGAVTIDPARIAANQIPPPVRFEGMTVDGVRSAAGSVPVIPSGCDNIEFHYTALSFLIPQRVKFKYRLVGHDRDWIDAGTRRTAYYTGIPPGEHVFEVIACNDEGIWNETGAKFQFRLTPPPWRTPWAYALYVIGFGGTVYGGVRWRLRALRRRTEELSRKVEERTAELARANEELQRAQHDLERKNKETEFQNRQLQQAKEEVELKNRQLDLKIGELAAMNADLVESQQQADRIFSALAEALPGTVLDGKYQLGEKIGAGGFGVVFTAVHLALNRPIAVKVFKPMPGNDSADAVERFKREGRSASRLNHPNAIHIVDSGISTEGIAYLVMELLNGWSLADELKRFGALTIRRCGQIIVPVCEALAEAHRLGIIHRDIKPENIFLNQTPEGEVVKVLDFGIAKLLGDDSGSELAKLTATGGIIGTPLYMAPERLAGKPYDGRSDAYSVGTMLYEMLSGRTPFPVGENGFIGIAMAHMHQIPQRLCEIVPHLPEPINAVVMRAIVKDPEARLDARELAALLAEALEAIAPEALDNRFVPPSNVTSEIANQPTRTISDLPTVEVQRERAESIVSGDDPDARYLRTR